MSPTIRPTASRRWLALEYALVACLLSVCSGALGYMAALAKFDARLAVLEEQKVLYERQSLRVDAIYNALLRRGLIDLPTKTTPTAATPSQRCSVQLTRNFAAREFDVHERYPDQWRATKLPQLAELCQWLRDLAAGPGIVTSAWRSDARNADVGGSDTSQHPKGEAADVLFPFVAIRTLAMRVLSAVQHRQAPAFGQVIFYADLGHVHVSLPTLGPRNGELRYSVAPGDGEPRAYPMLTSGEQLPRYSGHQVAMGFSPPAGSCCSGSSASKSSHHAGGASG